MDEEVKARIKGWVEQAISKHYDIQDYREEPFHWNDGKLAFTRYVPLDEDTMPEVDIDFYEGDKDKVGIVVWYPLTQSWIAEATKYNKDTLEAIDEELERIRGIYRGGVRIPFKDLTLEWSVVKSEGGYYYDDVGNRWRAERLWLGLTILHDRIPNQADINDAIDFLLAELTPNVILGMLHPRIVEVIRRIEELADGSWKP